ncbi:radical SAM protein [Sorangium cellulosum]|uniref:Radical SAM protein n=1 Tax=Sorangium cellulosum TaxID=56 RepID=A0A4P2QCU9_SORCE|nr:MSMEG_0568 family radical SAM protein [Sorangium cellulosum]AUX27565.1 radical SAM protein [Sorangium cellulosum]
MEPQTLITELQSSGLRVVEGPGGAPGGGAAPLAPPEPGAGPGDGRAAAWTSRRGGAGPTGHVAATLGGATVMIPIHTGPAATSPFVARIGRDGAGVVERDGRALAPIALVKAPRFYALSTRDGIPYPKIALLHGADVLASTVLQTCVRYSDPARACAFCAIGQSLAAGRTLAKKTPEQLAEVAEAAARLDGVRHVTLTTGTPRSADRGAAHLADCARAIKAAAGLPVQAQCEPPEDFAWFERMRAAGVDSLGMHLEAVEDAVRAAVMPGKAEVSVARYFEAFEAAVRVFGRGQVSTYLIAGLGDSLEALLGASERLVAMGVYPFLVPLVPVPGTPSADRAPPSADFMRALYAHLGPRLARAGLLSTDVKAGCARCGACSGLSGFEAAGRAAAPADPAAVVTPTSESTDDATLQLRAGAEPGGLSPVPPLAPGHLLRRARAVQGHG